MSKFKKYLHRFLIDKKNSTSVNVAIYLFGTILMMIIVTALQSDITSQIIGPFQTIVYYNLMVFDLMIFMYCIMKTDNVASVGLCIISIYSLFTIMTGEVYSILPNLASILVLIGVLYNLIYMVKRKC